MQIDKLFEKFPLGEPIALTYYLRLDSWSWSDALSIFCGIDPRREHTSVSVIRIDGSEIGEADFSFEMDNWEGGGYGETAYGELLEVWRSGKHESANSPSYYVRWALDKGFPVPWFAWAKERGFLKDILDDVARPKPNATGAPSTELGTRERDSLYKLIIGMAVGGYSYVPDSKSGTAREISEDMNGAGIPMDEDTVRKHLKAAAKLLPPKKGA